MPRTKILVSALALALAGTTTAQAQTFTSVISFGDSLSDAGQYAALPPPYAFGAGSFTTNPDDVWVQLVAQAFGLTSTASMAGGTNYAWGGAPTSFSVPGVPLPLFCVPSTLPCRSAAQQIADAGPVDPNALYTYYADANDIFNYVGYVGAGYINSAQAQAYTGASAMNAVGQIAGLQGAGAKVIVVLNLPDIGRTPNFNNAALFPGQATPANAAALSGLTFIHNTTLNAGLGSLGDGIVPINVYAMFNEILADPSAYGFTNTTGTACDLTLSGGSSLFCTPAAYRSPDANDTYVFADGVHPSGASHRMLASVVVSTLTAPGQVSMAGELPLQVYDDHSSAINDQIFSMNSTARYAGESNVYGQVQYSQTEFNATGTTNSMDSDLFSATFGGDVRASDNFSVGAAVTVGSSDGDSGRASIGGTEVLASVYGIGHFGAGYLDAILSYGSNSLSIDRAIVLGAATRIENGSTNASHMAAELGAGFTFGSDAFKHGPFLSWTWQEVSVDGYAEDAVDSTAMYFNEFDRKSSVGRVGYQASGTSGNWQPYGRIAFAYENEDDVIAVQAGSNTLNGHFTLDGFQPAEDWAEADLGVIYQLDEGTSLTFGYRGRFSDDTQDVNSINFGARWEFGESAPAPEPVAAPPEKTCSDLDDDGDGVNNCDDKCPGSEAGQAIGPDGCPVPLTIDLKGVNFDFDKDTLRPDAVAILDEAISILGKYPELKVEVAGHTDSKGTDEYNQALSERRARTVYDYLASHGIGAERLVGPVGYGESKPIAPNANEDGSDNPDGRAQNRRTELNVQN